MDYLINLIENNNNDKEIIEKILEYLNENKYEKQKIIELRNNQYVGKIRQILIKVRDKLLNEEIDKIFDYEKLKNYGKIYVIGHRKPDADSIFSSYVLRNILRSKGVDADFAVLEENYDYNEEDKTLIEEFIKEKPKVLKNIGNEKFILVDNNNPIQSVGLDYLDNIIGAVDHHIYSGIIDNTLEVEYSSTLLFIYDIFKNTYDFSEEEKKLVALSVMADTDYLTSIRYTENDKKVYDLLGVDLDEKEYRIKYFKTTNFEENIEKIFFTSYKKYDKNGKIYNKVAFRAYNKDEIYIEKYLDFLKSKKGIWIMIWANYENMDTTVYYKDRDVKILKFSKIITSANLIINEIENL